MCSPARLAVLASGVAAGCFVLGLLSQLAFAHDFKPPEQPSCTCPNPGANPSKPPAVSAKPKFAETNAHLDENDEIAALEDPRGAHRGRRRHLRLVPARALERIVQPTSSFKDPAGRVCRHILLIMTVGTATGRAEGIACRLGDGRWQLDG
jgi:hypothetical protein